MSGTTLEMMTSSMSSKVKFSIDRKFLSMIANSSDVRFCFVMHLKLFFNLSASNRPNSVVVFPASMTRSIAETSFQF
jgi:hypothetical protein